MTASVSAPDRHPTSPAPGAEPARPVTLAGAKRKNPHDSVPSPCVGVCKMDAAKGWCTGCFRTIEELTGWGRATDSTKLSVWARVEQRQGC